VQRRKKVEAKSFSILFSSDSSGEFAAGPVRQRLFFSMNGLEVMGRWSTGTGSNGKMQTASRTLMRL